MKRINIVYNKLVQIYKGEGIATKELVKLLNISRANISTELNRLCDMGKAKKDIGRPVLYHPIIEKNSEKNFAIKSSKEASLDAFIKNNLSLRMAGEQAKAAVLYPPNGMHMLILGETGAGKSMFAHIIHQYAVEMNVMDKDSPFIVFNCADYSNNPQLLMSQLFGVKKGSYTGATNDKEGLIEKSSSGILFLDEVHRLPAEGQEMFFTFMDQGKFRRLGETDVDRTAKVLIVSATTENPDSVLLNTFTRRIPMTIKLPNLEERGIEERFYLITVFLKNESYRLKKEIKLSRNSLKAFLEYPCRNNIGQLKADIQLVCAKAYADFLTQKKGSLKINSSDLPDYIKDYVYKGRSANNILTKLGINGRYLTVNKDVEINLFTEENYECNIYDFINAKINEMKDKDFSNEDLHNIINKKFQEYINKNAAAGRGFIKNNLYNLVDKNIVDLLDDIKQLVDVKLKKYISYNSYLGLLLYLNTAIEKTRTNKRTLNPKLSLIRTKYRVEFEIALEIMRIIEEKIDIVLTIDEAGFIAMFLAIDESSVKENLNRTAIIVICHGESTATSMAKVANDLLDENYAIGINLPLNTSPEDALNKIKSYIGKEKGKREYLFLVDMGSLTAFSREIEKEFGVSTRYISNVSTIHVIEATRKAILGDSIGEIYMSLMGSNNEGYNKEYPLEHRKYAVITACMTGEGSALIIKNFLQNHLRYNKKLFEIIPIDVKDKKWLKYNIENIQKEKEIICIVSSLKLDLKIPQYTLADVLNLRAIEEIQYNIDVKFTYEELRRTFKEHLKNTDGEKVYEDVILVLSSIQKNINKTLNMETFIPIALHIGCMMDRVLGKEKVVRFKDSDEFIKENNYTYRIIVEQLSYVEEKYGFKISVDEYCYITEFFVHLQKID